ncbi:MAG: efflux transporter outer membrane subunit [Verrucomicrobiota bacterium]
MKGRFGLAAVAVVVGLSESGCVLRNQTKSDPSALLDDPLPATWVEGRRATPALAVTGWLDDFRSPALRSLVHEAIGDNYALRSVSARIDQAEERARLAGADRLPQLDSSLRTVRSQNLRGAAFQSVRANNFTFSLDLAWEVDVWGRLKNLRDAQLDLVTRQTNLYESSRLSLAGNVAKAAFAIVESQQQISLTRRNLSSLQKNLIILDSKLEAGDADDRAALEISLSRADVARQRSRLLADQRQLEESKRALEILLGRYPAGSIASIGQLPSLKREIPEGLPSELLLRRPDLLAAEADVDSALKELAATRKELLPAFRITGSAGTSTTDEFGDLFDIQNLVWSIGQNLARPLYAGGRIRAEIRLDQAELDELASDYAEAALGAFAEVENALAAEWYLRGQVAALNTAVVESRRAESLSLDRYEGGLADIITVLESQRRAFDAESALLSAKLELLTNRVDLYLALGGDFDHFMIEK